MTRRPDQLDMQILFAVKAIRQQADAIRQRIHQWEPKKESTS